MAVAPYRINDVTTAEVIQKLIKVAKDIRATHQRGEEKGLCQVEISFCDPLAQNEIAVEVLGNVKLRTITHELLDKLKIIASVEQIVLQQAEGLSARWPA